MEQQICISPKYHIKNGTLIQNSAGKLTHDPEKYILRSKNPQAIVCGFFLR